MPRDVAITRCVAIFEALASEANGLGLSELSRRVDLAKSGVHRSLNTLISLGYVSQDGKSQNYVLTMRLTTIGLRHLTATGIPDVCQPVLDRLAAATGELVRMAVVEGETISWVAKAQGSTAGLRFDPEMGRKILLHVTATGKVWLSSMPDDEAMRLALREGFGNRENLGPRACQSVEAFVKELENTRCRGVGIAVDELEAGTSALAAAIRSPRGDRRVVGTVSVAGPTVRLTEDRLKEFARLAIGAAEELGAIWPLFRVHSHRAPAIDRVDSDSANQLSEGGTK